MASSGSPDGGRRLKSMVNPVLAQKKIPRSVHQFAYFLNSGGSGCDGSTNNWNESFVYQGEPLANRLLGSILFGD